MSGANGTPVLLRAEGLVKSYRGRRVVDAVHARGTRVTAPHRVRPYGDKKNDGAVQVSFTLSLPRSAVATEAAKRFAGQMGLREPYVTLAEGNTIDFYGSV